LFLAVCFRKLANLSAFLSAQYAVTLGALSNIPVLIVRVCDVAFLACALLGFDALNAIPDEMTRARATWYAVGLVANVFVVMA